MIENLAVTRDQYDCIDLTGNELRRLDNFPRLTRLRTLFASGNSISSFQLGSCLPNLEMLVLNDNPIGDIAVLEDLRGLRYLRYLSLIDCPVARTPGYRLSVIGMLPQLRALDFERITMAERRQAASITEDRARAPPNLTGDDQGPPKKKGRLDRERVEEALRNAKTLDEIKQLERILATGHVPN